jgi:hypothetical protein
MSDLLDSTKFFFDKGIKEITLDILSNETYLRGIEPPENYLSILNKKISQLIAKSWLPGKEEIREILIGEDQNKIRKLFVEEKILGETDAEHTSFDVDLNPVADPEETHIKYSGSIVEDRKTGDLIEWVFKIPYPPRPEQVTDGMLYEWIESASESKPWNASEISLWIPYTC